MALRKPFNNRSEYMSIGIIGSGGLGSNVARALGSKGIAATISNSRGPASLAALVEEVGPSLVAGTVQEAASADIVLLAVRWVDTGAVLRGLPSWNGRILIDGSNPVEFIDPDSAEAQDPNNPVGQYGIKAADLEGTYSSAVISKLAPGARVVKAFNHLDVHVLSQPEVSGGRRVLFYSGDDAAAKAEVRKIIEVAGFLPVDLGPLDVGGPLASMPFGALSAINFVAV
jgi:8-hydroxy-5-deazaflavin:NADPH oxidoreductase